MDSDTTRLALDLCHTIRSDLREVKEDMDEINRRLTSLEAAVNVLSKAMRADRNEPA